MRQSIILKLWVSIFGLILAVLIPLGLAMNQLFTHFYFRRQTEQLLNHGTVFARMLGHDPAAMMMLPVIGRLARARVGVIDAAGRLVGEADLPGLDVTAVLPPERLAEVLRGSPVTVRDVPVAGERHAAVAVPIAGARGVRGALLLLSPMGTAATALRSLRQLLLLAGFGALLLSTGLAFVLSRTVARRLIEMQRATRAIARGDYSVRVRVAGGDEVGLLGEAINGLSGELQRYEQTRREFLANVSHELRTPLSYIRGYSQALVDGLVDTPEEQARYHQIILEESVRLGRLVEDLLDLAQAGEGRLALQRAPVDVTEVARRALGKVEPRAGAQGVRLAADLPAGLDPVWADPQRVEQVILNLLDNAIRHTPSGGQVTVAAARTGGSVRVTVRDTGTGIPPEELPAIWERFHTVDRSRARDRTGRGLGLAIVRSIVRAHGGEVGAESTPGQGSVFFFTLPACRAVESR